MHPVQRLDSAGIGLSSVSCTVLPLARTVSLVPFSDLRSGPSESLPVGVYFSSRGLT